VAARVTPLHYSLFALEPQHGPSFSLSLLMQVHEAAAVVESGGDAGDAVAIRRRLCGGEGPVGMLGGGGPARMPVCCRVLAPRRPLPYRSATRRATATRSRNSSSIFVSTCPCAPRVFRRASQGPQGRVVPFGGARQGPVCRLRTAAQQHRLGRVPRFVGAYSSSPVHRAFVSGCEGPSIAELRSVACRVAS